MKKTNLTRVSALVVSFAVMAITTTSANAGDIFIGTISIKDGQVRLDRCDLAGNAYVLRDAEGSDAVARLRKEQVPSKGFWYGEVIGEYEEVSDGNGLAVVSIIGLEADRSCHLLDLLGSGSIRDQTVIEPSPDD